MPTAEAIWAIISNPLIIACIILKIVKWSIKKR